MLEPVLAILFGFIALMWSADRFIAGAASIANHYGMPKLLIGLTIVAFGTSAPEILVSLFAAIDGSGNLAAGNAIGSNLANIGMVLGITALIAPIPVKSQLIKAELPILVLITLIAGFCLWNLELSLFDSALLLLCLIAYMYFLYKKQSETKHDSLEEHDDEIEELSHHSLAKATALFTTGLFVLLISAKILVWGAQTIALSFGVSELVIGLTVVAIGTSLPELAASVASAKKGHHEIAFGNIIGSNIFNLLVVMGIPGFINTTSLDDNIFIRDFSTMLLLTCLWVIMMFYCVKRGKLFSRYMGLSLIGIYITYYVILFQQI